MEEKLYEKNGNCLYILNVLKKYSDEEHKLSANEIGRKVKEIYNVDIDSRTVRRNINLLKHKLNYDISTYEENGKGYYLTKDPETDFEPGEIRAIIDTFCYSTFIEPKIAAGIIEKCKNLQTVYDNKELKNYKIYSPKGKTTNQEVIKNIEDISGSIIRKKKIKFEYWKYVISGDKIRKEIVSAPVVSPYSIIYDKQQFYMLAIREGNQEFFHYRLDRIKDLQELAENIVIAKTNKEIEDYINTSVEIFSGNEVKIEAECNQVLLEDAFERFGKVAEIRPINNELFSLKLKANPRGFKFWAMRNLDAVIVTKPESLVKEIKDVLKEAEKRYGK